IASRSVEEYPGATRERHTAAHPRCVRACLREDSTMRPTAIGLMLLLTLSLLVAPRVAEAQQPTKAYRIGWLSADFPPPSSTSEILEAAFRQGLRALGYVEGQNLLIESRYAEGRAERLPDLAAELARLQVEVLVAWGAPAIRAAQHATRTIPIVMAGPPERGGRGGFPHLARPGADRTGVWRRGLGRPGERPGSPHRTVAPRVALA